METLQSSTWHVAYVSANDSSSGSGISISQTFDLTFDMLPGPLLGFMIQRRCIENDAQMLPEYIS